jgi:hypothetical protein
VTTIDHIAMPAVESRPSAEETAAQASLAEQRFLDSVRRRVAWQAEQAARLRALPREPAAPPDLLDLRVLEKLLVAAPVAPRTAEWTAFLEELRELADDDGRLPEVLERLVSVVFADLL